GAVGRGRAPGDAVDRTSWARRPGGAVGNLAENELSAARSRPGILGRHELFPGCEPRERAPRGMQLSLSYTCVARRKHSHPIFFTYLHAPGAPREPPQCASIFAAATNGC